MASFVLSPPPSVRVVSFFITARFAGQSDRAAFLEAVLGQLSELLGQSLPDTLTESSKQLWFLELLEQAAEKCARDGYRLILVIDGLDEDFGVLVGGTSTASRRSCRGTLHQECEFSWQAVLLHPFLSMSPPGIL